MRWMYTFCMTKKLVRCAPVILIPAVVVAVMFHPAIWYGAPGDPDPAVTQPQPTDDPTGVKSESDRITIGV